MTATVRQQLFINGEWRDAAGSRRSTWSIRRPKK